MADVADIAGDDAFNQMQDRTRSHRLAMAVAASGEQVTVCEECGEAIPPARIAAYPGCNLCLACKEESEQ